MTHDIICITSPQCSTPIIVCTKEINCAIFRHGVMKETGLQIDP